MVEELVVVIPSKTGWAVQMPLTCLLTEEKVKEVYVVTSSSDLVKNLERFAELYRRFDKRLSIVFSGMSGLEAKLFPFTKLDVDYVMLLDDDLYFRPGTVDKMVEYLEELNADAVVGTKIDLFLNYGDKDINPANKPIDEPVRIHFLDSAAVIFDMKKARQKMRIISDYIDNDMFYGSDFVYFSQIAREGEVYHVPSMFWHIGGGGKNDFLTYSDYASIMTALYRGVVTMEDVKRTFKDIYKIR